MDDQVNQGEVWMKVCEHLRASGLVSQRNLVELPKVHLISISYERVLVAVHNKTLQDRVQNFLTQSMQAAFTKELGHDVQVFVIVDESLHGAPPSYVPDGPAASTQVAGERSVDLRVIELQTQGAAVAPPRGGALAAASGAPAQGGQGQLFASTPNPGPQQQPPAPKGDPSNLNQRYTFETFVTGSSNRLASSAARAVAEERGNAYNPLFIYGPSGLGKTHLLHAIGWYALSMNPTMKVRYVNSEVFTNEFINSIQYDRAQKFQQRYRDVDFLLIDDIQFLAHKEETQEAFFHTFNALHQNNKQVVVTSDLPPKQMQGFEERLRSRFEWGLLTDVQPPSLETRIAILRMKAASDNVKVGDDVLEYIAERVSNNIRNLEGALLRVTAANSLAGRPVTIDQIEGSLRDIISDNDTTEVTVPSILKVVSNFYGISIEDIKGTSRSRSLVDARQVAMYISRELTDLSLPKIGAEFGGRDHSTVVHAVKRVNDRVKKEQSLFDEINELTSRVKSGHL